MAKYDHGNGCPCGLHAFCPADCLRYVAGSTAYLATPKQDHRLLPSMAEVMTGKLSDQVLPDADALAAQLPTDSAERKNMPIATGVLDYFPDALAEVARLSKIGNDKHNPGEPLHWSREKSNDHADCILRHLIDRGLLDVDGVLHDVKVAWRALAMAQLAIERLKERGGA